MRSKLASLDDSKLLKGRVKVNDDSVMGQRDGGEGRSCPD